MCPRCGRLIATLLARHDKHFDWYSVGWVDGGNIYWSENLKKGAPVYCHWGGCTEPMFNYDNQDRTLAEYLMEDIL